METLSSREPEGLIKQFNLWKKLNINNSPRYSTSNEYMNVNKYITKVNANNLYNNNLETLINDINNMNIDNELINNENISEFEDNKQNIW